MKWPEALVYITFFICLAAVIIGGSWVNHAQAATCNYVTPDVIATSTILYATNADRCQADLKPLTYDKTLAKVAQDRANTMAKTGVFTHYKANGEMAIWYALSKHDVLYNWAGENLADGFGNSMDMNNAWMQSPTHKANILTPNYTKVGVGISGPYTVVVFTDL